MKNLILMIFMVLTTGCSVFQPSEYHNYSTAEQTSVYATGEAANQAGSANGSYNCPSCVNNQGHGTTGVYGSNVPRTSSYSGADRFMEDTGRTLNSIFQQKLYEFAR